MQMVKEVWAFEEHYAIDYKKNRYNRMIIKTKNGLKRY